MYVCIWDCLCCGALGVDRVDPPLEAPPMPPRARPEKAEKRPKINGRPQRSRIAGSGGRTCLQGPAPSAAEWIRIESSPRPALVAAALRHTGTEAAWRRQQAATWRSNGDSISDGEWHHLSGVVDSKKSKVLLIIDGVVKAESPWTADTLDDSDGCDIVVGADSGEKKFGDPFQGVIYDVRIVPSNG